MNTASLPSTRADAGENRPPKVVVIGQGYVGLPVSMRAVEVGYDVIGFDVDKTKVDGMLDGVSHIDDITGADIAAALETGRFRPTATPARVAGFDYAVITVPTPLRDGAPDMRYIESAAEIVAPHIQPDTTVILESTTYPGTTELFLAPILERVSGLTAGVDFYLGFSPERIDPGNPTWTFVNTPKVVSGVNTESLAVVDAFYRSLVDTTVPASGTREAEMAKLLENTFRHVNIALVNEIATNARSLGIDFWDVIAAASSKPFGFMTFYPGPGVGGHCLPIDPTYLSWQFERELGTVSRFVKAANEINAGMPGEIVRRVQLGLNERTKSVKGSRVLVLGVAYKKNSNDARETPATGIIDGLVALGADVHFADPLVEGYKAPDGVQHVTMDAAEVQAADCVVLITDHDDFDYDLLREASYVFDTRNKLSGDNVECL